MHCYTPWYDSLRCASAVLSREAYHIRLVKRLGEQRILYRDDVHILLLLPKVCSRVEVYQEHPDLEIYRVVHA